MINLIMKFYCNKNAKAAVARNNLHLAAVKKNNMKNKNKDLDKFYTKMRAPYERVFSKTNHRVRYQGIAKNQFTTFMESIVHNGTVERQIFQRIFRHFIFEGCSGYRHP